MLLIEHQLSLVLTLVSLNLLGRSGCNCFMVGRCLGTDVDIETASNEFECLDNCKGNTLCQWVTYEREGEENSDSSIGSIFFKKILFAI